jgi:DNA-binding CsgD family transcriptional regulator
MSSSDGRDAWISAEERTVLAASATGRSVAEVAELLGQPPEVVRRQLASAITKLGARSKLEAVVLALRRGLIILLVA